LKEPSSVTRTFFEKTTASSAYPVTVSECKTHSRIVSSADDTYLQALIRTAEQYAESYTGRALLTSTYKLYLNQFPSTIVVPRSPLVTLTSVKYNDNDGAEQTLDASKYTLHKLERPFIVPAYGENWPATRSGMQAVTVEFTAGYGAAASDIPEGFRHALLFHVAHLYENREPDLMGSIVSRIPNTLTALLNHWRIWEYHGE
jgi:uncharacterized phiE125 gp8 family phage protein